MTRRRTTARDDLTQALDWFERRIISHRLYWRVQGMGRVYPAPPRDHQDRADVQCTISPRESPLPLPRTLSDAPANKPKPPKRRPDNWLDDRHPWARHADKRAAAEVQQP
jgi:hypothetical protein